jgi:hypothetical protein
MRPPCTLFWHDQDQICSGFEEEVENVKIAYIAIILSWE